MSKRIALIVGVNKYKCRQITQLDGAVRDAKKLARFLKSELPPGERFRVVFLKNPTLLQIVEKLNKIQIELRDETDPISIFYFGGHGTGYSKDSQALLCKDALSQTMTGRSDAGALTPEVFGDYIANIAGRKFVCFDVCRTCLENNRANPEADAQYYGTQKFRDVCLARSSAAYWTLSSCADGERSSDDGVFMDAMLDSMRNALDNNEPIVLDKNLTANITRRLRVLNPLNTQHPTDSGQPIHLCSARVGVEYDPNSVWGGKRILGTTKRMAEGKRLYWSFGAVAVLAIALGVRGMWNDRPAPEDDGAKGGTAATADRGGNKPADPLKRGQELVDEAKKLADEGNIEQAVVKMDAALKLVPSGTTHDDWQTLRGEYAELTQAQKLVDEAKKLADEENIEQAVVRMDAALKLVPSGTTHDEWQALRDGYAQKRGQELVDEAKTLADEEQFKEAVAKVDEALALVPSGTTHDPLQTLRDGYAALIRGQKLVAEADALAAKENIKEAIAKMDEALALAPSGKTHDRWETLRNGYAELTQAQKLVDEAKTLADEGELEQAIAQMDEALKIVPSGTTHDRWQKIRGGYSSLMQAQKLVDEAKTAFEKNDLCQAVDKMDAALKLVASGKTRDRWQTVRAGYAQKQAQKLVDESETLADEGELEQAAAKMDAAIKLVDAGATRDNWTTIRDGYAAQLGQKLMDEAQTLAANEEFQQAAAKAESALKLVASGVARDNWQARLDSYKNAFKGQNLIGEAQTLAVEEQFEQAIKKTEEALKSIAFKDTRERWTALMEALKSAYGAQYLVSKDEPFDPSADYENALTNANEALKLLPDPFTTVRDQFQKIQKEYALKRGQQLVGEAKTLADKGKYEQAVAKMDDALALVSEGATHNDWQKIRDMYLRQEAQAFVDDAKRLADSDPENFAPVVGYMDRALALVHDEGWEETREVYQRRVKGGELKTVTVNGVEYRFRWCPAGTFMMGSNDYDSEKPIHKVTLTRGFWLQETETTQRQWKSIMGGNPSEFKGDNLPVESVSWNDVAGSGGFIEKINANDLGLKFRLPTEAEWEYAARSGQNFKYSGSDNLNEVAWYDGNSSGTHEVGTKKANGWGLHDMSGNVREWTADWYDSNYYNGGSMTDPHGPNSGSSRVSRGGGWSRGARYCRSACRYCDDPEYRNNILGFRLLLESAQ